MSQERQDMRANAISLFQVRDRAQYKTADAEFLIFRKLFGDAPIATDEHRGGARARSRQPMPQARAFNRRCHPCLGKLATESTRIAKCFTVSLPRQQIQAQSVAQGPGSLTRELFQGLYGLT